MMSHSAAETMEFGREFGRGLSTSSVLCFFGDLAAGKTTFIKGLVEGVGGGSVDQVSSPTFVYLNIYEGEQVVYHFDLYRLGNADEFFSMGFDEYFSLGICCVEWSERIAGFLPPDALSIHLSHCGENLREITYS